jgi:hypothetical protein
MSKSLFYSLLLLTGIFISFSTYGQNPDIIKFNTFRDDIISASITDAPGHFYSTSETTYLDDESLYLEVTLGVLMEDDAENKLVAINSVQEESFQNNASTVVEEQPFITGSVRIQTEEYVTLITLPIHTTITIQNITNAMGQPVEYIQDGNEILLLRYDGLLILHGVDDNKPVTWKVFVSETRNIF